MHRTNDTGAQRSPRGTVLRLIWATTSVLLTLTMIAVAWATRGRVIEAVKDLDRSQGEVLLASVREALRSRATPPATIALDSFLVHHPDSGLKAIALYGSDDSLVSAAGPELQVGATEFRRPGAAPRPRTMPTGMVQMFGLFRPTARQADGRRIWAGHAEVGAHLPPSVVVVEFVPALSRGLLADADRTFALAAITGCALVAATLLFWRLGTQYETAQQRNEHQGRLAALGEMSAIMAHEIRNPLASLKGNAQLLARRMPLGSAEARKADLVVSEAMRLETLSSDLLDFARSGQIDARPTDPVELVTACVDTVAPDRIEVRSQGAPRMWPLDGGRMRQVLVNVLQNAVQASPPGARVTITVGQEGDRLVFAVEDQGTGIPSGDEERLFAPFYSTRTTGTGLGLAVARRIAELHGGTISASNHSSGALFRVVIGQPPATPQQRSQSFSSSGAT